jgi:hypothetical protein
MDIVLKHLTDDELAERICLIDGIRPEITQAWRGMSREQIKKKVDEELRGQIERLRAELAELHEEPSEQRAAMLDVIEGMEAEDREESDSWNERYQALLDECPEPSAMEAAHDLTNAQLRQTIYEELTAQALTK